MKYHWLFVLHTQHVPVRALHCPLLNHKCSVPERLSCASHRLLPGQPLDKVIGMMYKLPGDDRQAILATELLQVRHLQVMKVDQVQGKDMSTFCNCTCNSHDSLLMLTCFASQMLADVHAKGIAHGDLKPANIFLDLQSCQTMTHVLDWGLAKRYQPGILQPAMHIAGWRYQYPQSANKCLDLNLQPHSRVASCPAGEKHVLLQGTLEYLAPEVLDQWIAKSQGLEPAPCDPASADMWSMGVVLFEVYTCKNPFRVSFVSEYAHQLQS